MLELTPALLKFGDRTNDASAIPTEINIPRDRSTLSDIVIVLYILLLLELDLRLSSIMKCYRLLSRL